jgi:hypothetical protein
MSTLIANYNSGDLTDVEFDFGQVTSVLPNRQITARGSAAGRATFSDTTETDANGKIGVQFSIFATSFFARSMFALEVTEPAGAAHGYPGLCNIDGKKVADGELYEEQTQFRQQPELTQEKWSW